MDKFNGYESQEWLNYWGMNDNDEIEGDPDYINELCERADYYGMESLTEYEQYLLNHKDAVK